MIKENQKIGRIANIIMGLSPSGKTYNREGVGLPLLNGPTEFGTFYPNCTLFTTDSKRECKQGDLIFCVRGNTTGRMNWADRKYSLGRGVCGIRGESWIDTKYIKYCLEMLLSELLQMAGGSTMPNLTQAAIKQFPIPYPPHRSKIAAILSAYDDLIENNLRRIKILEEMAQLIYREWFVHFRFPGHEKVKLVDSPLGKVPEGWEVKNLLDVADVTYGFAFKSKHFNNEGNGMPVVRIRNVLAAESNTFSTENAGDKYLVKNGDILVGMDGDFHMGFWSGGEAYLVQRVARFRSKGEIGSYHLFLALKEPIKNFNATITGTTVAHLGDKHIRTIKVLWPTQELISQTREMLDTLLDLLLKLRFKNQTLRQTRDLLLPKLISGELDVSDLDIDIGGLDQ